MEKQGIAARGGGSLNFFFFFFFCYFLFLLSFPFFALLPLFRSLKIVGGGDQKNDQAIERLPIDRIIRIRDSGGLLIQLRAG